MAMYYRLSPDEIEELVKKCTQSGIEAYKKQQEDDQRKEARTTGRAYRMKEKLSCYRRVKKAVQEDWSYTEEERREYRLKFIEDLMGDPLRRNDATERMLIDREEKRRQDIYSIQQIDKAMSLYRQEVERGNEEEQRRYRTLYAYYIQDEAASIADIAAAECVSEKTVYRDLNIACEIIYQYVIGM